MAALSEGFAQTRLSKLKFAQNSSEQQWGLFQLGWVGLRRSESTRSVRTSSDKAAQSNSTPDLRNYTCWN